MNLFSNFNWKKVRRPLLLLDLLKIQLALILSMNTVCLSYQLDKDPKLRHINSVLNMLEQGLILQIFIQNLRDLKSKLKFLED